MCPLARLLHLKDTVEDLCLLHGDLQCPVSLSIYEKVCPPAPLPPSSIPSGVPHLEHTGADLVFSPGWNYVS